MFEPPAWVRDYIGIPWTKFGRTEEGCDCWGLVCLVLKGQFNITLPIHEDTRYKGPKHAKDLGNEICNHTEMTQWTWTALEDVRAGDCLLLCLLGHPIHVSIVVAPGIMLHIEEGIDSFIENYNGPLWERRIFGAYRHESML